MSKEIVMIPISKIIPDKDQPRRNFDAVKLKSLMDSIEKHGIRNPLIVEAIGEGYLLEDGERRYRAAKELGMKEVPAIVEKAKNATERLIIQFHLQEQHEGWSGTEKSVAIGRLSKELGISMGELGKLLGIPDRTVNSYVAFYDLLERKEFAKEEISLYFAQAIVTARKMLKYYANKQDKEFSVDDERGLELAVIDRCKKGEIEKKEDLTKIKDAGKINVDIVKKFIKSKSMTLQQLYIESEGKAAYHFRNIRTQSGTLRHHIDQLMVLKATHMYENAVPYDIAELKSCQHAIGELLMKIG